MTKVENFTKRNLTTRLLMWKRVLKYMVKYSYEIQYDDTLGICHFIQRANIHYSSLPYMTMYSVYVQFPEFKKYRPKHMYSTYWWSTRASNFSRRIGVVKNIIIDLENELIKKRFLQ